MSEEKAKTKRKIPTWVFVIVGIIVVGTWIFGGGDESADETAASGDDANAAEETEAESEFDPSELPLDEWVAYVVEDEVGAETNNGDPRIDDLRVNEDMSGDNDGKHIALITMNYGSSMTANTARRGMWNDAMAIMERLFERGEFSEVVVFWLVDLTDQYGNTTPGEVMKITFSEETADRVNWDAFDVNNIPNVADDYFQHPAIDG